LQTAGSFDFSFKQWANQPVHTEYVLGIVTTDNRLQQTENTFI